jgi:Do/DeqQ family serine protease
MRPQSPRLALIALAASAIVVSAQAQESAPVPRGVPTDATAMRLSFAPIVRRAAPAVVNVYSKRLVRQQADPFWGMFGGAGEHTEQSLGSGSIVRADGVVLTNHHNIAGAQEIMVVTSDRREWPATVLIDDARADLAVLKIDTKGEKLPSIPIDDAERPQVGDLVLAIGDPFGVGQTVTNGIVSALARSGVGISNYSSFIQTDAAINPGNSGGPLVDMSGNLIGVNTAIISASGASAGVGFAIPAATARQVVNAALGGGHSVTRPWLGVKTQALTGEMARSLGLEAPRGVVVTEVWPGGPAARAGLAQGDVIVSVDGQEVDDEAGLNYRVGALGPGAETTLIVRRNGASARTFLARVEAPPSQPAPESLTVTGRNPLAGATAINLSPAAALDSGADPFAGHGVMVAKVEGGFAQTMGLQAGDFIRQINGRAINTTADLAAAVKTPAGAWTLTIERGGRTITAQFNG